MIELTITMVHRCREMILRMEDMSVTIPTNLPSIMASFHPSRDPSPALV